MFLTEKLWGDENFPTLMSVLRFFFVILRGNFIGMTITELQQQYAAHPNMAVMKRLLKDTSVQTVFCGGLCASAASLFSSRKPLKKAEQFLLTDNRTEGDPFSAKYVKEWAKDRVADSGSTINIKGLENIPDQNGILFMSNHQSNFDIPLLLAELPVQHGFVAKVELDHIPFFSRWMRCIHCLFMDRNDMKQSAQTIPPQHCRQNVLKISSAAYDQAQQVVHNVFA